MQNVLTANHPAQIYIDSVLAGKQTVGKLARLFIERHVKDLAEGHKRGLSFDPNAAQRVIDFFGFLKPSKWSGDFKLLPWQQAWLAILFGWLGADGYRRYRTAYLEVARKNGKSALLSGLGLYFLSADNETGAEVYSAATTKDQARRVFDESVAMRSASPALKKHIAKSGNTPCLNLHVLNTASKFMPCSRDEDAMDGYNVHAALVDEVHRHKSRDVWDVLRYGMRSRKQPMLLGITTAGSAQDHESLCWTLHDYSQKVLEGVIEDDAFCPLLFNLDSEDDWEKEENWIKANPSLGVTLQPEGLRQEALEAKNQPSALNNFKRFCLNLWVDSDEAAVETEQWDACIRSDDPHPDVKRLRIESEIELKGKPCFAGLDLALTTDLSALVLIFPPQKDGERWRILPFFWIPADNISARVKRDHVPYDVWEREGFLITTPGNATDFDFIEHKIIELSETYDIHEMAYDPAYATPLTNSLVAQGFPIEKLVKFAQTMMNYAGPCDQFIRKILNREFAHDGDPILRWMVSNLVWKQNATGLKQPDKDKSSERIDGVVATIMALARAVEKPAIELAASADDLPMIWQL